MRRNEALQFVVRGGRVHELRFHFKHAGASSEDVNVGHANHRFGAHALQPNAGHAIGQGGRFAGEKRAGRIDAAQCALLLDLRSLIVHHRGVSRLLKTVQILFQTVISESGHDNAGCLVGAGQFARAAEFVYHVAIAFLSITFVECANLHKQNRFRTIFCGCFLGQTEVLLNKGHVGVLINMHDFLSLYAFGS